MSDAARVAFGAELGATLQRMQATLQATLNALFGLGHLAMDGLRAALHAMLREGAPDQSATAACLRPQQGLVMRLPVAIGDYTDFFTSWHHAFNVGSIFRPENPVLPNFRSMPVAYHGRSSSVVVGDEPVWRPQGQFRAAHHSNEIVFGPTRRLDLEMELGAIVGTGNARGAAIGVDAADAHIAGLCLLNDWSARDIQAWETQPLGPFLGKNFATTISPWVVTMQALQPFRAPAPARRSDDPALMPYLHGVANRARGALQIHLVTQLRSARMRDANLPAQTIATALFSRDSDWTWGQMVAHHTINGCNLRTGDLLGSGTISGPGEAQAGSLLELTRGGQAPLTLASGEQRAFLEDGDEVVLRAYCEAPGQVRIGFGECRGVVAASAHP